MSLNLTGTEDRDPEIVPSAEGQKWDFGHETTALRDREAAVQELNKAIDRAEGFLQP